MRLFPRRWYARDCWRRMQPSPTFRTNTNLVIVNVAIKDKSGKPIEDLKKDQFTLLEDGKPQQIAVFELQRLNGDILPPLEVTRQR